MFDHTTATPEDIDARRQKFVRRAPFLTDRVHFEKILASFPEDQQDAIRAQVEPLLTFE